MSIATRIKDCIDNHDKVKQYQMVKTINNINALHHSPRINPWAMMVTPHYNKTVSTVSINNK